MEFEISDDGSTPSDAEAAVIRHGEAPEPTRQVTHEAVPSRVGGLTEQFAQRQLAI